MPGIQKDLWLARLGNYPQLGPETLDCSPGRLTGQSKQLDQPSVSRAERKRTSGAEQNRTTERHVVKHQGPGGVRARFRQLPEVGWTSCCV